jgi:hypothetical protein
MRCALSTFRINMGSMTQESACRIAARCGIIALILSRNCLLFVPFVLDLYFAIVY